jgi:hypothetical protein
MKLLKLKRNFLIYGACYATLLIIITVIYSILVDKAITARQKNLAVQSEVMELQNKLTTITKRAKEVRDATNVWQKLNEKHKKSDGLKIDSIKGLFDDFKKKYKLSDVDVDLSAPVELADVYKTETTVVVSSKVTVQFKGITDEYVLSFVDAVQKDLPGYVRIENLQFSRIGEISEDVVRRVSKGEFPGLVGGSITFQWRGLKDIPAKKILPKEQITPTDKLIEEKKTPL